MQRWHVSLGLAGALVVAAFVVPRLPQRVVSSGAVDSPILRPARAGALSLRGALDRGALPAGVSDERYLVFEVTGANAEGGQRAPVDLAVVLDLSGSMVEQGRIEAARAATAGLIDQLGPEDRFALITFSDQASVRVPLGVVVSPELLHRAVAGLDPQGGTNLYDGLSRGFAQLEQGGGTGPRRVVLISDGLANIGVTDDQSLIAEARHGALEGLSLSALGLGLDYNEDLLSAMSEVGGGRYRFAGDSADLGALFQEEFAAASSLVGRELRLDVALAPGVSALEVYGWDATRSSEGFSVFLGDLRAGETRKVVARVGISASEAGKLDVARASLGWVSPLGEPGQALASKVGAEATENREQVRGSVDKEAALGAARAVLGGLLDASARALEGGRKDEATAILEEAKGRLGSWSADYGTPELQTELGEISAQSTAFDAAPPSSPEASYHVKWAKERARGLSQ